MLSVLSVLSVFSVVKSTTEITEITEYGVSYQFPTRRGMVEGETAMKINVVDREESLLPRLRERLDRAAQLRCSEHDQPVLAVTIHSRENGWFDARWTTCCESLEQQAQAIVKTRC